MTSAQSIETCFRKYATLKRRASRSEFWWFAIAGWPQPLQQHTNGSAGVR